MTAREDRYRELVLYVLERLDRGAFDATKGSFGRGSIASRGAAAPDLKRREAPAAASSGPSAMRSPIARRGPRTRRDGGDRRGRRRGARGPRRADERGALAARPATASSRARPSARSRSSCTSPSSRPSTACGVRPSVCAASSCTLRARGCPHRGLTKADHRATPRPITRRAPIPPRRQRDGRDPRALRALDGVARERLESDPRVRAAIARTSNAPIAGSRTSRGRAAPRRTPSPLRRRRRTRRPPGGRGRPRPRRGAPRRRAHRARLGRHSAPTAASPAHPRSPRRARARPPHRSRGLPAPLRLVGRSASRAWVAWTPLAAAALILAMAFGGGVRPTVLEGGLPRSPIVRGDRAPVPSSPADASSPGAPSPRIRDSR